MTHEKRIDTTELSMKLEITKQPDFAKNPHRLVGVEREKFLKEFCDFQIRAKITEDGSEYVLGNYLPQLQKLLVLYEADKDNLDYFESILHFYFSGEVLFLVGDNFADERHDDSDVRLALKQILAKINELGIKEKLENNYFPPNDFLTYSLNFSDLENNNSEFMSVKKVFLLKKYIKHGEIELIENLISEDFPIYINYVAKILPLDNSISDELKIKIYKFILKNLKLTRYVFDNIERVYDNAHHLENIIGLFLSSLKTTIKSESLLGNQSSEYIILNVNKLISIYYFQDLDDEISVDQRVFSNVKELNKNYKFFRTFIEQYGYLLLSWQTKTMGDLEFKKIAFANITLIHYLKGKKKKLIANLGLDEVNFIIRNLIYGSIATILFINDKSLDKTYTFNYVLSLLVPFNLLFSIFNEYFDILDNKTKKTLGTILGFLGFDLTFLASDFKKYKFIEKIEVDEVLINFSADIGVLFAKKKYQEIIDRYLLDPDNFASHSFGYVFLSLLEVGVTKENYKLFEYIFERLYFFVKVGLFDGFKINGFRDRYLSRYSIDLNFLCINYLENTISLFDDVEGLKKVFDLVSKTTELVDLSDKFLENISNNNIFLSIENVGVDNFEQYLQNLQGTDSSKTQYYNFAMSALYIVKLNFSAANHYFAGIKDSSLKSILKESLEKLKNRLKADCKKLIKDWIWIYYSDGENKDAILSQRKILNELKFFMVYPENTLSDNMLIPLIKETFEEEQIKHLIKTRANGSKNKNSREISQMLKEGNVFEVLGMLVLNMIVKNKNVAFQFGNHSFRNQNYVLGIPDFALQNNIGDFKLGGSVTNLQDTIDKYSKIIEDVFGNTKSYRKLLLVLLNNGVEVEKELVGKFRIHKFDKLIKILEWRLKKDFSAFEYYNFTERFKKLIDRRVELEKKCKKLTLEYSQVESQIKEEIEKQNNIVSTNFSKIDLFITNLKKITEKIRNSEIDTEKLIVIEKVLFDLFKDYALAYNDILIEAMGKNNRFTINDFFRKFELLAKFVDSEIDYDTMIGISLFKNFSDNIETDGKYLLQTSSGWKYVDIPKSYYFRNPYVTCDGGFSGISYKPVNVDYKSVESKKKISKTLEESVKELERESQNNGNNLKFHYAKIADKFIELYEYDRESYANSTTDKRLQSKSTRQKLYELVRTNLEHSPKFQRHGAGVYSLHYEQIYQQLQKNGGSTEMLRVVSEKLSLLK